VLVETCPFPRTVLRGFSEEGGSLRGKYCLPGQGLVRNRLSFGKREEASWGANRPGKNV